MTIASITVTLLLLLLPISETHAVESNIPKHHPNLASKRRFLSPSDLHGTYTRFLELSENSTLCPNFITHNTNGVLYPSGYIHLPFDDIIQDGHPCVGPGDLAVRFRRRMNPKELENEFNITAGASGIDKMVRDILLALDGFYFGRQTKERNCQASHIPSSVAFFFTSQARPFAANVGVPFRQNPKIMFIVDTTRVCAFSGSFVPPKPVGTRPQSIPQISRTPKPYLTSSPKQPPKSPSNTMQRETTKETDKSSLATEDSMPLEPTQHVQNKSKNSLGTPTEPEMTPVLIMSYEKSTPHSQKGKNRQHTKEIMKTPILVPTSDTSGSDLVDTGKSHEMTQRKDNKRDAKSSLIVTSLSPSPSNLPQKPPEESSNISDKHSYQSGPQSSRTSSPPSNTLSQSSELPTKPSSSPTRQRYEISLPTVSQRLLAKPIPSKKAPASPDPHSIVLTADNISSSPQPQISSGEMNHSYSHSHGLQGSEAMISAIVSPVPSAWEEVIGDSGSTCFPSSANVMLWNGSFKRMDELAVGVRVSVGNGKSSTVIDFSHFDHTIVSAFLHLKTDSGNSLTVTPSHFIYTESGLIPAGKVILGDYLKLSDGRPTRVVNISRKLSRGLFNPHTSHGDIIVDGFIVSTYTLAAAPMTAHALLAPIRFIYANGFRAAIVSKLAQEKAIVRIFRSLLSSSENSVSFKADVHRL